MPGPTSFRSAAALRAWFVRHHANSEALSVRIWKAHALDRGIGYSDALDEALCFGWIDGVRHRLDDDSFSIRFSPRKPRSIWSAVNIRRARALERAGRMRPPGLAAFRARQAARSGIYAFEQKPRALSPSEAKAFRANARAWSYFKARPPWYQRTSTYWVVSAKRDETRSRRLELLIRRSARGEDIPPLRRESRRAKFS
jgi:uncharacterized protein YdeI (YjbR/CyaY-like superfamily)